MPELSGGSLQILTTCDSIVINLQHNNEWIALANCSHCVGVVARCALLRHAFTAQITSTCVQSNKLSGVHSQSCFSKQLAWLR